MTVEYITDFYETKEGFFLDWMQTPGPPTCGGVILGRESESGTVVSPGYNGTDGLYLPNLNCLWIMQAEENKIWQSISPISILRNMLHLVAAMITLKSSMVNIPLIT